MKSLEMKNISDMKNTLNGIRSVLGTTEEKISKPEDRAIENIQNIGQKEVFFLMNITSVTSRTISGLLA